MIELTRVEKSYPLEGQDPAPVLRGVNFSMAAGEFTAIVGPSGCGKTSLLNIVGGLDSAYTGDAKVQGVSLPSLSDQDLSKFRNRCIGFVFQSFNLVAPLTAAENVGLPAYFSESQQGDDALRAQAALDRVGLAAKADHRPGELSGGERQRVAIARALFGHPALLLCDEPTGNLDMRTGGEIVELFKQLNTEGLTILVVTHEERMWRAARRVLQLREGQLESGEVS